MISTSAILISVILGFRFLFPIKVKRESITLTDSEYKKTYFLLFLLWLISGGILSTIIYLINNKTKSSSVENFDYNLYPDTQFWVGSSVIIGFLLAILITFGLIKIILKDKSNEFWTLYDLKYKFKAFFILKILIILLTIIGVTLNYLGRNSHFKISSKEIKVSRLFEMSSQEFKLDQIREINHILTFTAPNGNIVNKPHYEIIFTNGYTWNTKMDLREPKIEDDKIFQELSLNSKVKIK